MIDINAISGHIKDRLLAIEDSAGNRRFHQRSVKQRPTGKFDGYPAAVILGAVDSDPEFLTNVQNKQRLRFTIAIYVKPTEDAAKTKAQQEDDAWTLGRNLQSAVITALDTSGNLGGEVAILDPAGIIEITDALTGAGDTITTGVEVIATVVYSS